MKWITNIVGAPYMQKHAAFPCLCNLPLNLALKRGQRFPRDELVAQFFPQPKKILLAWPIAIQREPSRQVFKEPRIVWIALLANNGARQLADQPCLNSLEQI